MLMLSYPDYDNSILNVISSVRRYYRTSTAYPTLPLLDDVIGAFYKNVVLILLDGMGMNMAESLPRSAFLRRKISRTLTSVFPSADMAAYTSCLTGLSPNEHGWLGRKLFFKEFCRTIDIVTNTDAYTKGAVTRMSAARFVMPHEYIFGDIANSIIASVQPFTIAREGQVLSEKGNYHKTAVTQKKLFDLILRICATDQHTFTFVRWNEPAELAELYGCDSDEVKAMLGDISANLEAVCGSMTDTLFIVTSSHGMTDISDELRIDRMRDITDCLTMPPFVEGRAVSFFVKSECRQAFERLFIDKFSSEFILLTRAELFRRNILGRGITHPKTSDFVGDYMACAISDKSMRFLALNEKPVKPPAAMSGGLTDAEMLVPLAVIPTKQTAKYRPPKLEDITPNRKFF